MSTLLHVPGFLSYCHWGSVFPLPQQAGGQRPPACGSLGQEEQHYAKVSLGREATELVRDDVTGVLLQAQEEPRGSTHPGA